MPLPHKNITIGDTPVVVEVADTEGLRQRGLSGRDSLAEGEGMLFVFEQEGAWGFWMKDMRFPLDIIWADSDGTIVTIAANTEPDSYPHIFNSGAPAQYVLEVPAGFAAQHGIAEGDKIVI